MCPKCITYKDSNVFAVYGAAIFTGAHQVEVSAVLGA